MVDLYRFGYDHPESKALPADGVGPELLGGKGAGLGQMASLGVPVPPGVVIPASACGPIMSTSMHGTAMGELLDAVLHELHLIRSSLDRRLLVSVRSSGRVSMPGMMDTFLNVGLSEKNLDAWIEILGERTALDCYRRLLESVGEAIGAGYAIKALRAKAGSFKYGLATAPGADLDAFTVKHLKRLIGDLSKKVVSSGYVRDWDAQLRTTIRKTFASWGSPRALAYRKEHGIPNEWGTAVIVQVMVMGNLNDRSGSGVLFTRDPDTGAPGLVGEYLPNAQGEDVVSGARTPKPLSHLSGKEVYSELAEISARLENHYRDVQDIEFTVEDGKLWILQTRAAKRTARAAFRIAHDMLASGALSPSEALSRVTGADLKKLAVRHVPEGGDVPEPIVRGLAASSGVARGVAVHSSAAAAAGTVGPCILIRPDTSPDDFPGMLAAAGMLTGNGGFTSHAAVVARSLGKPCVTGAGDLSMIPEGAMVTIDGSTGRVWVDADIETVEGEISDEARRLLRLSPRYDEFIPLLDERELARALSRDEELPRVAIDLRTCGVARIELAKKLAPRVKDGLLILDLPGSYPDTLAKLDEYFYLDLGLVEEAEKTKALAHKPPADYETLDALDLAKPELSGAFAVLAADAKLLPGDSDWRPAAIDDAAKLRSLLEIGFEVLG